MTPGSFRGVNFEKAHHGTAADRVGVTPVAE
jgi:hypothetical protein